MPETPRQVAVEHSQVGCSTHPNSERRGSGADQARISPFGEASASSCVFAPCSLIGANETDGVKFLLRKRWCSWPRLACLFSTLFLLWVALRMVNPGAFLEALSGMAAVWVALAFLLYGMALAAGAARWHVALRCTERAIHFLATWRLSLIGHFFFTTFFGAIGGDAAKSVLYAKWFRFALPKVLAAAALDRVLNVGGAVVLAAFTLFAAVASGGTERLRHLQWEQPGAFTIAGLCLVVLALGAILLWKPRGDGSFARTVRALRTGGRRFILSPRTALPGLFAGLLAQTALSAVFAFNLAAVSDAPVSWAQLAWTFPAITALSCLPFTVAGAGVRELAALTFLGAYGVPAADAVAASMLTMILKLAWAGVGAGVLWREQRRRVTLPLRERAATVSVVIPTLNEAAALEASVHSARANSEVMEVIVVDGGSGDGTPEIARRLGCLVLASRMGRGQQLRLGTSVARGDVLLFLHADTLLPATAARAALNCLRDSLVVGGGFWKAYGDGSWLLSGSRIKCALRLLVARRILGDQAMFVRRDALAQIGGVPELQLMEEFELCRRLRRVGRLALAEATVVTSARRFARLGLLRMTWRTWWLSLRYRLGTPPRELRRIYERD
jgi:rSAM/selenodomain-associated transferase 2